MAFLGIHWLRTTSLSELWAVSKTHSIHYRNSQVLKTTGWGSILLRLNAFLVVQYKCLAIRLAWSVIYSDDCEQKDFTLCCQKNHIRILVQTR
jgi:hypothetical protein